MILNKIKEKYDNKINKRDRVIKQTVDVKWVIRVSLISFILTIILSGTSNIALDEVNIIVGLLLVLIFILLGVIFDMIGIAVASADQKPFHSMASKQVKGSKMAIKLIKNAEKVSSFCNDVIGDICNIISGSVGAVVAVTLSARYHFDPVIVALLVTSVIASLTVGGKAMGKSFAINKSEVIIYEVSKFLNIFSKNK